MCLDILARWPLPALLVRWALSIGEQDGYVSLRPSSSSHCENPDLKGASLLIALPKVVGVILIGWCSEWGRIIPSESRDRGQSLRG